jgi:hypothetical protein
VNAALQILLYKSKPVVLTSYAGYPSHGAASISHDPEGLEIDAGNTLTGETVPAITAHLVVDTPQPFGHGEIILIPPLLRKDGAPGVITQLC